MSEKSSSDAPVKASPRVAQTVGFLLMMAGVVGVFAFLSSLDPPPNLPSSAIHQFRFDTNGQLVGLAAEDPTAPLIVEHADLELDLKAIETRINVKCASCHGAPGEDLTSHACAAGGLCVPTQHPPKATCIKCHRHGER